MTLPNTSVQDITADTLLTTSKPKLKSNDDDLLENDVYVEANKTDLLGTDSAGTYSGWDDMIGNIVVKGSGANDPNWAAFNGNIYAYSFSASAMNQVWIDFHITHNYKPGTKIYLHTHWSTAGTNTGVVRWGFEYSVAKGHNQQNFPSTTTVYVEQAAQGTAHRHMIAEISLGDAVPSTNIEVDSVIMCRIFRDATHANDTCTDASFLILSDCHFETDRHCTKNKAPNFYT